MGEALGPNTNGLNQTNPIRLIMGRIWWDNGLMARLMGPNWVLMGWTKLNKMNNEDLMG